MNKEPKRSKTGSKGKSSKSKSRHSKNRHKHSQNANLTKHSSYDNDSIEGLNHIYHKAKKVKHSEGKYTIIL